MRDYLSRIIGWADQAAIDRAELMLELALHHTLPLVIAGRDNLQAIAYEIHRRANPGPLPPFVVCDTRRCAEPEDTARSAPGCATAAEALERARGGGTICVVSRRLPGDFLSLRAAARSIRLFVIREDAGESKVYELDAIRVLRLRYRADRERVVLAVAAEHGVSDAADISWLLSCCSDSHDELAKGCARLAALRRSGTLNAAAAELGMSRMSLERWLRHRGVDLEVHGHHVLDAVDHRAWI